MSEVFQYFEEVAGANAKAAMQNPGDRRLAINAIMTLDGFFGTLHTELFKLGHVLDSLDDKWKETLSRSCQHYRVLRDAAYALKHGTLDHPKPRLVRRSDQILTSIRRLSNVMPSRRKEFGSRLKTRIMKPTK
jgi:hypothetical protein